MQSTTLLRSQFTHLLTTLSCLVYLVCTLHTTHPLARAICLSTAHPDGPCHCKHRKHALAFYRAHFTLSLWAGITEIAKTTSPHHCCAKSTSVPRRFCDNAIARVNPSRASSKQKHRRGRCAALIGGGVGLTPNFVAHQLCANGCRTLHTWLATWLGADRHQGLLLLSLHRSNPGITDANTPGVYAHPKNGGKHQHEELARTLRFPARTAGEGNRATRGRAALLEKGIGEGRLLKEVRSYCLLVLKRKMRSVGLAQRNHGDALGQVRSSHGRVKGGVAEGGGKGARA